MSSTRGPSRRAKDRGTSHDASRELKKSAKQLGIQINTAKYNKSRTDVPPQIKGLLDAVLALGEMKYHHHRGSAQKPWPSAIQSKASHLMTMAIDCRRNRKNEASWRDAIESKLFERFDLEVACNDRTTSLTVRQSKRKACTCNSLGKENAHSSIDSGISNLFSSRLDTAIFPSKGSPCTRKWRPDRIYGLRRTDNFDACLRSPYTHDRSLSNASRVEDVVKTSIHGKCKDSELMFPFLILEAKSGKAGASFEEMEMQVCIPIQEALQLQWNILKTPGNSAGVSGASMVWSVLYRGEDWRIYSGHTELREGKPKYFINYLWGGSITGDDESLQLMLIIDYIVDWARDTFRPDILKQLKSLASEALGDEATVNHDTMSLNGQIENWVAEIGEEAVEESRSTQRLLLAYESDETEPVTGDAFEQRFTTAVGLVKDGRRISSRIKGLWLTRNNLETLFLSFNQPKKAEKLARQVLALLKRQGVVLEGEEVLGAVEELWTGRSRGRSTRRSRVHVQMYISFYINPVWDIVRELTYLAVEEDALQCLHERAAHKRPIRIQTPECRKGRLLAAIGTILDSNVKEDLVSSLCRRTYVLGFNEPSTVIFVDNHNIPQERQEAMPAFKQTTTKELEQPAILMQGLIHMVFATMQSQFENHGSPSKQQLEDVRRTSSRTDVNTRPLSQIEDGVSKDEKVFLVYSNVPSARHLPDLANRKYCLYILDEQQVEFSEFSIASKLSSIFHQRAIYFTERKARVPVKAGVENREGYAHPYRGATLGDNILPEHISQQDIFDWIKLLYRFSQRDPSEIASILSGLQVS